MSDADLRNPPENIATAFGYGKLIVDVGTFHGRPAVFIAPTAEPGLVGGLVPDDKKGDLNTLEPGEQVLTFPTEGQARFVADALMGRVTRSGTPPTPNE